MVLFLFCSHFEMLVSFETAGTNLDAATTEVEWECCPLEVGILTLVSGWVEFRCTNTVRIAACDFRSLVTQYTCSARCHSEFECVACYHACHTYARPRFAF